MNYRYFAFISYSHEDAKEAIRLQKRLERYRLPSIIRKANPDVPKYIRPVFRDATDLGTGALREELKAELNDSKYLIVICSSHSARSKWVGREIAEFVRVGREKRIIPYVVERVPPGRNPVEFCFHPLIPRELDLLGIDVPQIGREQAFVKVVARLLDLRFDMLWQRHKRYLIRRIVMRIAVGTMAISLAGIVYAVNRPFTVHVALEERTVHNDRLPCDDAVLTLIVGGDTLARRPATVGGCAEFRNVPGKFRSEHVALSFEAYGYHAVDTLLPLESEVRLPVHRDDTFARVRGYVRSDRDGYLPVSGAEVEIAGISTRTDERGYFEVRVPLEHQNRSYRTVVRADGDVVECTAWPEQHHTERINTFYLNDNNL